ncbi:pleiotropic drug resistance protein 3-like [Gossypium australe]|uniref:Pleiotropic drug resistance protein 3-like n=1 Tax=Gossypium australe TaxID=47621 RepID=A0A5B6VKM2_9ROSI|nr:pleiotropic drug resistance protein 3-like [Gossypium australe]
MILKLSKGYANRVRKIMIMLASWNCSLVSWGHTLLEPVSFEEVETIEDWKEAMRNEISMIHKNQT